jgi:hypothetical protein
MKKFLLVILTMLFATYFYGQELIVKHSTINNNRVEVQIIPQNMNPFGGLVNDVELNFEVISYVLTSLDSVVSKFEFGVESYNYDLSQHSTKQKGYFNYCWYGSSEKMDTIKLYFKAWQVGTTPLYFINTNKLLYGVFQYPMTFNNTLINVSPLQNVNGKVLYSSDLPVIIPGSVITAYGVWQKYYHTWTTDPVNGTYDVYLPKDAYNINVTVPYEVKGVNASDALTVARHFVGIQDIPQNRLIAADVNEDGNINTTDALDILKHFVKISEFGSNNTGPYWYLHFNQQLIVNYPMTQDFYTVIIGDANGSWTIENKKSSIILEKVGQQMINEEIFDIPVKVSEPLSINSLSLGFKIKNNVEILDVKVNDENGQSLYNVIDDKLIVSWFTLMSLDLNTNDVLLTITVKSKDKNFDMNIIQDISQLTDLNLVDINTKLYIPEVTTNNILIYPNPTREYVNIEYNGNGQNITIDLYNILGSKMTNILTSNNVQGQYTIKYDMSNYEKGVYFYVINNGNKTDIRKIILN